MGVAELSENNPEVDPEDPPDSGAVPGFPKLPRASAGHALDVRPKDPRRQVVIRLTEDDDKVLSWICKATGLPAALVFRAAIREMRLRLKEL